MEKLIKRFVSDKHRDWAEVCTSKNEEYKFYSSLCQTANIEVIYNL